MKPKSANYVRRTVEAFLVIPSCDNADRVKRALLTYADDWVESRVPKEELDAMVETVRGLKDE